MFQAALTVHDIDADSVPGTTIITDDRSSCWFSDDDEVSECVCVCVACVHVCVCIAPMCVYVCVFGSLPVKESGRKHVHCTLSQ